MAAFATTALVFAALLIAGSIGVSLASGETLRSIRMTGPTVKRWSGYLLTVVGLWFVVIATWPTPTL